MTWNTGEVCGLSFSTPLCNPWFRERAREIGEREKGRAQRKAKPWTTRPPTPTHTAATRAPGASSKVGVLRAIRVDGASSAAVVQVRMEDPIYDAVTEENYAALVARRREDADAFIIDDDGLGYDGSREEDSTHRALPSPSDEGSRSEDGAPRKRTARWVVAVVAAS
ncbi:DNA polymerase alpha catalytic subunit [Hordeum vulgare]|nr:DNA polymerase alpha catalytic subunit [Hordeum vulgare]